MSMGIRFSAGLALALLQMPLAAAEADLSLRLLPTLHSENASSPFAAGDQASLRSELLLNWQRKGWTFTGALSAEQDNQHNSNADAHLNELFYETSLGDWELSLGQKRLGWGVGFGFRPLDTLQREPRRPVQPLLLDGVPALIAEQFTDSGSLSLIYAARSDWDDWQIEEAQHSATVRLYHFSGAWEFFGLSSWEENEGATLGGGFSLVEGDNWKFHGELVWKQHYQRWQHALIGNDALFYPGNPMYQEQQNNAWQSVFGAQWTDPGGLGVLLEYWYDGSAWSGDDWQNWHELIQRQQAALPIYKLPTALLQRNIAAAEQAYLSNNLLRHNVLLRLSHDSGDQLFALEYVLTPEDGGSVYTLSFEDKNLKQQKIRFGARFYSGPDDSAYGALGDSLVIFATWEMGWRL